MHAINFVYERREFINSKGVWQFDEQRALIKYYYFVVLFLFSFSTVFSSTCHFFDFIIVLLIWACLIAFNSLGSFYFFISFNILLAFELLITPSMRCDPSRGFIKKNHLGSPRDNKRYIFSLDTRVVNKEDLSSFQTLTLSFEIPKLLNSPHTIIHNPKT